MGSSGRRVTFSRPTFRAQTESEKGPAVQVTANDADSAQRRVDQIVSNTQEVGTGRFAGQRRDTARTAELRSQIQDSDLSRAQRELDFARGRERAEIDFGDGALGRVRQERSDDTRSILDERRAAATQGFDNPTLQATREQGLSQLNRQNLSQQRNLRSRQAASGVSGGIAAAQQMALQQQQQSGQQQLERQLFLDDVAQRRTALGDLETSVAATERDELNREQFNLEQRRRETLGRITGQFAEAGLGVADRTAAISADAAREAAESSRQAARGGKK